MLRAILFDFDGTIVLSEPLHFAAFAEVLAKRGITLSEASYYERYLSLTDRECVERMIDDFALPELRSQANQLLREKTEAMNEQLARGVPLCRGVQAFIAAAAARSVLAVVSCGLRREIEGVLSRARLDEFFPVVVSAEDVSAGKPDPEGYRLGWQRLRSGGLVDLALGECLVIEDSPKGIDAAHAAGMRVVAFPHTRPAGELAAADLVSASYSAVTWRDLEGLFS
jgi:HAD superfamily hydrolase (TIGR01509 family)